MNPIGLLLFALVTLVIGTVIGTFIMFAGWNWGAVAALTFAKPIGLGAAFWLSLIFNTFAISLRAKVSR